MRQHRALGVAGGAGGVADEGEVVGPALLDGGVEVAAVRLAELATHRLHVGERLQPVVLVVQHSARIVVDHVAERRELVAERHHLVDLLLVLGHDHRDIGVIPDEGQLLGDGVLVDGHRRAAQALRGHLRPVQTRPIVADDRQAVFPFEPEGGQPQREVADLGVILRPRARLPDPTILLADRGAPRQLLGVAPQQAWQRREVSHGEPPSHCSPWGLRGTP